MTTAPQSVAARRWMLLAGSVTAAAELAGVGLPDGAGQPLDDETRPAAQALLASAGAVGDDGGLEPGLAAAFAVCAAPLVTVEVQLRALVGASRPVAGWTVWFVVGERDLLVIAQRGDTPWVEVLAADPLAMPAELRRLLPALGSTGAAVRATPAEVVPLAALAQVPRDGDVDLQQLAEATGTPADRLVAAARVVEQAQQTLRVVVAGRPRPGGVPVGTLLWYRLPGGWLSVTPAPDGTDRQPVRIAATDPAALPTEVAGLVAGALG